MGITGTGGEILGIRWAPLKGTRFQHSSHIILMELRWAFLGITCTIKFAYYIGMGIAGTRFKGGKDVLYDYQYWSWRKKTKLARKVIWRRRKEMKLTGKVQWRRKKMKLTMTDEKKHWIHPKQRSPGIVRD